jgi:outer membrane protein
MRRTLSFIFAAMLLPLLGMAQTPAAQIGPAKIAWMNLEQTLLTTDEGKVQVAEIQKYIDSKNQELDAMRKESEKLRNNLSVQGSKLTDEARADLEEQVEAKDTALQRFQQDTQKEIENRRIRMTNYLAKKMQPVLEKLSKEKGLSAILIFNASRDAYVDASLNITEDIVKAYNQAYPVSAGKPPAAPAPTPAPAPKK